MATTLLSSELPSHIRASSATSDFFHPRKPKQRSMMSPAILPQSVRSMLLKIYHVLIIILDSAGGLIGALLMYPALELLGRRMTVIIADTIFIIGAVFCTVPTHQLGLIYAGRFFTGMGVGGIAAVSPIYIAEISPVSSSHSTRLVPSSVSGSTTVSSTTWIVQSLLLGGCQWACS
jgi:MFS family permease